MDCVFERLVQSTRANNIGFINGDIMVFDGFVKSVAFASSHGRYMMVGRRHLMKEALRKTTPDSTERKSCKARFRSWLRG